MILKIPVGVLARGVQTDYPGDGAQLYDIPVSIEMLDGTTEPSDCAVWLRVKSWKYEHGYKRPKDYEVKKVLLDDIEFSGANVKYVESYVKNWIEKDNESWIEFDYLED